MEYLCKLLKVFKNSKGHEDFLYTNIRFYYHLGS